MANTYCHEGYFDLAGKESKQKVEKTAVAEIIAVVGDLFLLFAIFAGAILFKALIYVNL